MKKGRSLVVLFIILALLVGSYAYLTRNPSGSGKDAKSINVISIDVNSLKSINLKGTDYSIDLEKSGNEWSLKSSPDMKLDQDAIYNIANTIAVLNADRIVDEAPQALQDYGLKDPAVTVSAVLSDGSKKVLYLGNMTPNGNAYYLMAEGDPKLYTVSSTDGQNLSGRLNDIRDKNLSSMDQDAVDSLRITKGNSTIEFAGAGDRLGWGKWAMVKPYSSPYSADDTTVDNLVSSALHNLTVSEFIDDNPSSLAKYGLDKPTMQIELKEGDSVFQLYFGKDEDSTHTYMKTGDSKAVYTVDKEKLADFTGAEPFTMLDKSIFIGSIDDLDKIEIDAQGRKYVLEIVRTPSSDGTGSTSAVYKVNGKEVKEEDFKNFLTTLYGLSYEAESAKNVPDTPDLKTVFYANKGPEKTVTVEYAPCNADFYGVFRNGKSSFLVSRDKVNGVIAALKQFDN